MDATPNTLSRLLHEFPDIRSVAFNGGTALRTVRLFAPDLFERDDLVCERLPSTSPRNARLQLSEKVEAWRLIIAWLRGDHATGV
jgi:G:T/U-mismatch repair DNA glycosylase